MLGSWATVRLRNTADERETRKAVERAVFQIPETKQTWGLSHYLSFVELCGAVMRSHDSSRQWTFELVEEYDECEE